MIALAVYRRATPSPLFVGSPEQELATPNNVVVGRSPQPRGAENKKRPSHKTEKVVDHSGYEQCRIETGGVEWIPGSDAIRLQSSETGYVGLPMAIEQRPEGMSGI